MAQQGFHLLFSWKIPAFFLSRSQQKFVVFFVKTLSMFIKDHILIEAMNRSYTTSNLRNNANSENIKLCNTKDLSHPFYVFSSCLLSS